MALIIYFLTPPPTHTHIAVVVGMMERCVPDSLSRKCCRRFDVHFCFPETKGLFCPRQIDNAKQLKGLVRIAWKNHVIL